MKAARIHNFGSPDVVMVEDVPVLSPRDRPPAAVMICAAKVLCLNRAFCNLLRNGSWLGLGWREIIT